MGAFTDCDVMLITRPQPRSIMPGRVRRIRSASDAAPHWSPSGGDIAFHSNRSGNNDIWVIPAGGGTATGSTIDWTGLTVGVGAGNAQTLTFQATVVADQTAPGERPSPDEIRLQTRRLKQRIEHELVTDAEGHAELELDAELALPAHRVAARGADVATPNPRAAAAVLGFTALAAIDLDAEATTQTRQEQALRQELADQPSPACPQRRPDAHLPGPDGGPGQE